MDNVSFRYTEDEDGWITGVYFGCMSGNCSEFIGDPTDYGYPTWEDWADNVCINAWRVTVYEGVYQLHHDASREEDLLALYEERREANRLITKESLEKDIFNLVTRRSSRRGVASIGNLAFEWGFESIVSGDTELQGSYSGSTDVSFTRVFAEIPCVVVSFSGDYANQLSTACRDVSTTGFKPVIKLTKPNITSRVHWIAIGVIDSKALG